LEDQDRIGQDVNVTEIAELPEMAIFSIEDKNCDNRKFMLWLCI